ncbi:MAG: hypothetical protein U0R17_03230 [Acidimicrobiia bacterium]
MRKALLFMLIISGLTFASIPSALAAGTNQTKISVTLSPSNKKILKNDLITYKVSLTNVGTSSTTIYSPSLIYTPKEFTFTSATNNSNFECSNNGRIAGEDNSAFYIGREKIYCAPKSSNDITVKAFQSYNFEINGYANTDYVEATTAVYSIYVYEIPEEAQNDFVNGVNIWEKYQSIAINNSKYNSSSSNGVTSTTAKSSSTIPSQVLGADQENTNTQSAPQIGSNSAEQIGSTNSSAISKKAPKVNPIKFNTTKDSGSIRSDKKSTIENLIAFSVLAVFALMIITYWLTKHIKRRNAKQRDYKHAVAILRHKKINRTTIEPFTENSEIYDENHEFVEMK